MKKVVVILVILNTFLLEDLVFAQSVNTLWYKQPAQYFEESLVLGNGTMGASVFGGVNSDKIFLNDATLWSGVPVDANMNPEAYKTLPALREALKNENYKLADELNKKLQGSYSQSYVPLGTLYIECKYTAAPNHYYRELNIGEAVSKVKYEADGVQYSREYFISNPDHIMIIRFTSSQKSALSFNLRFESLLKYGISSSDSILKAKGYAPFRALPSYLGDIPNAVVFDENKGTRFTTLVKIKNTDGEIVATDTTLGLKGGTEAIIFISVATSFNGFDKDPAADGLNAEAISHDQLANAFSQPFRQLKQSHLADYQKFFNRVNLNLGKTSAPDLPTDERLKRYTEGKEDKNLEILYFQVRTIFINQQFPYTRCTSQFAGHLEPIYSPPLEQQLYNQY